jgi:hypothetical protein
MTEAQETQPPALAPDPKAERLTRIRALAQDAAASYRRRLAASRAAGDSSYGQPYRIRTGAKMNSDTFASVSARVSLEECLVVIARGPVLDAAVAEFDGLDDDVAEQVHDWLHEAMGAARPQLDAVEALLALAREVQQ